MAGFFPNLLVAHNREWFFGNPENWVPGAISIMVAAAVWAVAKDPRVPLPVVMNLGLVFEVVSNYGIAMAEFIDPMRLDINGWIGLSWVAVWAALVTVVVPTPPRKARW